MISSKPAARALVARQFNRISERLEQWRKTRKHRARIPERLWKAAVRVARKHGLHRTARALRLDYYSDGRDEERAEVAGRLHKT
jgi:hypothetical protein